jgi:hypothetical protein
MRLGRIKPNQVAGDEYLTEPMCQEKLLAARVRHYDPDFPPGLTTRFIERRPLLPPRSSVR